MVFEFSVNGSSAILAGGRYAKLISEFGGKDYSAIGFALGIERMIIVADQQGVDLDKQQNVNIVVVGLTPLANEKVLQTLSSLRQNNISAVSKFDCNDLTKAIKYAEKINASNIIIIGEKELADGSVTIKNLKLQKQTSYSDFSQFLKEFN
jgi:histidyl-tRNA synthetase